MNNTQIKELVHRLCPDATEVFLLDEASCVRWLDLYGPKNWQDLISDLKDKNGYSK